MEQQLALASISISLGTLTMLLFYFLATVYIIFSAVMYYHWNEYSTSLKVNTITLVLYALTTLPLMSALLFFAVTI